jgi:hypothetical protein
MGSVVGVCMHQGTATQIDSIFQSTNFDELIMTSFQGLLKLYEKKK